MLFLVTLIHIYLRKKQVEQTERQANFSELGLFQALLVAAFLHAAALQNLPHSWLCQNLFKIQEKRTESKTDKRCFVSGKERRTKGGLKEPQPK